MSRVLNDIPFPPSSDAELDWGLRAIALARETGAPLLACLAGIRGGHGEVVELGFAPAPAPQLVGDLETAMLADFVLGGALRAEIGRVRPLPTLTLSLDLVRSPGSAAGFTAQATETAVADGLGTVAAVLRDNGSALGHACATFAVPSRGQQRVLPWDAPNPPVAPPPLKPAELDSAEATALSRALDSAEPTVSWGDRVVAAGTSATVADDEATLRTRPTAALANRAGGVQGGVVVALAARAARSAVGVDGAPQVRSVTARFVGAADTGTELRTVARVQHRTRRTAFVDVTLTQEDTTRASCGIVCRLPGGRSGGSTTAST